MQHLYVWLVLIQKLIVIISFIVFCNFPFEGSTHYKTSTSKKNKKKNKLFIEALKTHQTPWVNPQRVPFLFAVEWLQWLECLASYCLGMELCDSDKRIERAWELLRQCYCSSSTKWETLWDSVTHHNTKRTYKCAPRCHRKTDLKLERIQ